MALIFCCVPFFIPIFYVVRNIKTAIATINKSSMIVTVVIGKLNTAPKQAHLISFLLSTLRITPKLLKPITAIVAM